MAKSLITITVDYINATAQAAELDNIASVLRKCGCEENSCRALIAGAWQGEGAGRYLAKLSESSCSVTELARKVENIADTVRRIARRTFESEMKALDISRTRTY